MASAGFLAEAFALGLSSGPACLASCGPVLVPVLAAERKAPGGTGLVLGEYLAGRFSGYLAFALLAWALGLTLELTPNSRLIIFGLADLATAVMLAIYGVALGRTNTRHCEAGCPAVRARTMSARFGLLAPLLLGFFSGVSLCPPFVAAGVRAAQGSGLLSVLVFFACFFAGTTIWFVPSLGVSLLRRSEAAAIVARLVLFLLAGYYAYLAVIILGGMLIHG